MKIYTRMGDRGKTNTLDRRIYKDDIQVETYGTVDELNAFVGEAIGRIDEEDVKQVLLKIQSDLFSMGADLSRVDRNRDKVNKQMVSRLEKWIDLFELECPKLQCFILPGGSIASSALHICRVVCRRAERRVVTLAKQAEVNPDIGRYLNRLSDLFFVLARLINVRHDVKEMKVPKDNKK